MEQKNIITLIAGGRRKKIKWGAQISSLSSETKKNGFRDETKR